MKVNTLIIGAGRSGTTSLYEYLVKHPEVNFSITKEVHYFSIEELYQRKEKYFHSLFESNEKKVIATADTYLLIDKDAPDRIKKYNPDIKIIVMLREPIARAFSNYNYSVQFGHEHQDVSFMNSIELEQIRTAEKDIVEINNLCHCYGSLYYKHISYWMQFFPMQNFIFLKLEDLISDDENFYRKLTKELNIQYVPFPESETKFNAASGVKSKWLQQFILNRKNPIRRILALFIRPFRKMIIRSGVVGKLHEFNKKDIKRPKITEGEKMYAQKYFEQDLLLLEKNLGISFKKEA